MVEAVAEITNTASNGSSANGNASSTSTTEERWKHPVYGPTDKYTPGIAPIKKEFILPKPSASAPEVKTVDDDAAESSTGPSVDVSTTVRPAPELTNSATTANGEADGEAPKKKLKGAARKRARREEAAALAATQRAAKKAKNGVEEESHHKGGQNRNRQFKSLKDSKGHCHGFLTKGEHGCKFTNKDAGSAGSVGNCRFSHDLVTYLADKARDIHLPSTLQTSEDSLTVEEKQAQLEARYSQSLLQSVDGEDTFVRDAQSISSTTTTTTEEEAKDGKSDPAHQSLDFSTSCPIYSLKGFCTMGWKCRFLGAHVKVVGPSKLLNPDEATGFAQSGLEMLTDKARLEAWRSRPKAFVLSNGDQAKQQDQEELNFGTSAGMKAMRIRKYPLPKTKAVLKYLDEEAKSLAKADPHGSTAGKGPISISLPAAAPQANGNGSSLNHHQIDDEADIEELENSLRNEQAAIRQAEAAASSDGGVDTARIRPSEKRRLNWKGELYLAPLTTTGNLPFRRICSSFGSDIHCGEMGLAESFLHGNASEWSLVRRWEGERIFGTQLCGGKPDLLVPVAEALKNEIGDGLDFVDINCGCPIDLVFNKGAGSALLDHPTKLSKIVRGMNAVLGDTPLTIKLRTGTSAKQTTHKLFARLQTEWGASAATLHGRSRKQRYKNDADWGYIKTCADTLRDSVREWNEESRHADEEEMVPIPVYGNGDVYSWQDYYERLERTGVDGEMIARGALIKPWLFTEIKERRDWDISSRERLDMIREFSSYGLSHWGSDTHGVNTTRRFLCEMLSFTHRYVPTGLLEFLPARLNDRPPLFRGRDELETLLASSNSQDWVKISEMFLGKAPEEWSFTPKHKSSSYADVDAGEQQQG